MPRLFCAFLICAFVGRAAALEPREVFLLVNRAEPASRSVAEHYAKARQVPLENIIELSVTTADDISREDYAASVVNPVRKALKGKETQAKVLLSIYGMPLRVAAPKPNATAQQEIEDRQKAIAGHNAKIEQLNQELAALKDDKARVEKLKAELTGLKNQVGGWTGEIMARTKPECIASLDSELMLLWWDNHPLAKKGKTPPVMLTARLDGPTAEIAKRLVDDAITAEKTGLQGKVYVDAQGKTQIPKGDPGWGYEAYDFSMREMATLLKDKAAMDVTLDDKEALMPVQSGKQCALYCGWYSVRKFVDCCEFVPGAIAWHLASYEMTTLHGETTGWCKNLLLKGAAVTLGSVEEPFTAGFPKPAEFFGLLATGEKTLVEVYAQTTLLTSWTMVLIGDPLYRPFAKQPKLKTADVKLSPVWGKSP
jgi:uncharacterized protein (TIGR03790 family)